MTEDAVVTWAQFKDFVTGLATTKTQFFCRGHANENWTLRTTFHRRVKSLGISMETYLDNLIPQVHYEVAAAIDYNFDLSNETEFGAFLALAQHHGFSTPLLDWTLSPYIAAYFAYREVQETGHSSENVKIFAFDHASWAQDYAQPSNLRLPQTYISVIRPLARLNYRILPQQGVFTVTNVDDMEEHIRANETNKKYLRTVRLSVKERPTVMRDLQMMGIDERTLFPGLDGLFHSLRNRLLSADVIGETNPEMLRRLVKPSPVPPTPKAD